MSRDQNRRSYIVFCAVMSKASKFSISQLNRSTRKSFIGKIAIHIEDSAPQLLSSPFIAIGWGNRSGRRRYVCTYLAVPRTVGLLETIRFLHSLNFEGFMNHDYEIPLVFT